jgi:vacuolar-type H+-ATPase subunit E/Vma4
MALTELISRLEQEAQLRIDALRRESEEQVRAIDAATAQAASELTTRHVEEARARRRAGRARVLAAAQRQARARALDATHAQVARILDRARALIDDAAASPAYASALPRHLDEALSFLQGLRPRVRCRESVAAIVRSALERHAEATLVVDNAVAPGVVAEAEDGSVTVDNTLRARLAQREPDLACALARRLTDGRH